MYYRPTRLLVVKFLGLFGGSQIDTAQLTEDKKLGGDSISRATTEQPYNAAIPEPPNFAHLDKAIEESRKKIVNVLLEKGVPGMTVSVARCGRIVWSSAFGYCDVENQVPCLPEARMRIASISKPLFVSTVVAPMIEQKKLDINTSIYEYISTDDFPRPKYLGKEFDITIAQLLSHTSGIRHYDEGKAENKSLKPIGSQGSLKIYQNQEEFDRIGFFQRKTYRSTMDALEPFRNDPLVDEPGHFNYTTYGYTLLSAVIEKARHKNEDIKERSDQIEDFWIKILRNDWKLKETSLDQDEPILTNRARYYLRSGINGCLINAPYQDGSVKWAGGGIVSTTRDLVKFGIALVDSYKEKSSAKLKKETLDLLWTKVSSSYGLGFQIMELETDDAKEEKIVVFHLGGALGASSALIIFPETEVVVAILANLGDINVRELGFFIAKQFEKSSCH